MVHGDFEGAAMHWQADCEHYGGHLDQERTLAYSPGSVRQTGVLVETAPLGEKRAYWRDGLEAGAHGSSWKGETGECNRSQPEHPTQSVLCSATRRELQVLR